MNVKEEKPNGIQLLMRAVVKDQDGRIISDTGYEPSKSFVIQFLEFFYHLASGPAGGNATQIDGSEDQIYYGIARADNLLNVNAQVNEDLYGIVIGIGTAPVSNTDYKLDNQLEEGVAAGRITHGVQTVGTAGVVGVNVDLEIKRSFTNNTGSTITVTEAGVYARNTGKNYSHCLIRDLLAASVDVPDKCSLTVYYTLRTTV